MSQSTKRDHTVVIIGTGFGATMTGIPLARQFKTRNKGETILMLERGTWWTTPVGTVQDKEVKAYDFLKSKKQPVQFWPAQNHFRGLIDILTRCYRRPKNADGLFEFTLLGKRRFLGLFGENDGVSVIRANGVGGGSLVYSNITIRPPDLVLDDPRWPVDWQGKRDYYYDFARHAIGYSVMSALQARDDGNLPYLDKNNTKAMPAGWANSGLSNIVTRSARLNPHWDIQAQGAFNRRGLKQIHLVPGVPADQQLKQTPSNALLIDRGRVFQTAVSQLTNDFGAVDLAINDLTPEGTALGPTEPPPNYNPDNPKDPAKNYCERQGRCNVGCLPGARHTLNKQLMGAVFGKPDGTPGTFENILMIEPLAEVDVIRALDGGGYEIRYLQRDQNDPSRTTPKSVTADKVIVSAGCLGTSEIMLRSKAKGTLPNLSDKTGFGFSTNGDYVAFLEGTAERVSLLRGPVTTSFAHFNTTDPKTSGDPAKVDPATFHTLEDQGIPPALATLAGVGEPFIRSLAAGRRGLPFVFWSGLKWGLRRLGHYWTAFWNNFRERQDIFQSEDEVTNRMMCVVAMGREASVGQFRLGGPGETPLRLSRADGKKFHEDPIYDVIRGSLARLERLLSPPGKQGEFQSPFFNPVTKDLKADAIALSHPLGGCIMASDASRGAVDQYGHVFDKTKTGARPFYEGLYIADASIIPTALGVNPALTISALSLRVADNIIAEL
ncbi:MAG: GMC family oxidoreductase [bacterium]